ncbi:hypothetical protein ACHAWF_008532, partial [Thalassiosira exigua]
ASNRASLLTTFLFHLEALLPEYCDHLAAAASGDVADAARRAHEAAAVLEGSSSAAAARAGAPSSSSAPGSPRSSPARTPPSGSPSAPSSPLRPPPSRKQRAAPRSAGTSPSPSVPSSAAARLVRPPSPRSSSLSPRKRGRSLGRRSDPTGRTAEEVTPTPTMPSKFPSKSWTGAAPAAASALSASSATSAAGAARWNSVAASEWERFASPFLLLAGAECLYARMEHVLDPNKSASAKVDVGDGRREGGSSSSSSVQFGEGTGGGGGGGFLPGPVAPPPPTPHEADRRGSRRLIAMYRQIREDCIIVGEYLCDPVLGARIGSATGPGGSPRKGVVLPPRLPPPPPPLNLDAASSRSSSPEKAGSHYLPTVDDLHRCSPHERREMAAISLRDALDALIAFIDGRCVLVRIHAELCRPSSLSQPPPPPSSIGALSPSLASSAGALSPPLASSTGVGGNSNSSPQTALRSNKWTALAEQCRCVSVPVTAWAKEEGCATRISVANIQNELKALELMMMAMHYLFECDLFNCVLTVRQLYVLLRTMDRQKCLPILYIEQSLRELLSMMHVYFADAGVGLETLRKGMSSASQTPLMTQPLPSGGQMSNSKQLNKVTDFNALFAEFLGRNANGASLAVVVARRQQDKSDLTQKAPHATDEGSIEIPTAPIWEPLYINSNNIAGGNSDVSQRSGPNFARMIGRETVAKASCENTAGTEDRGSDTSWPKNKWRKVEEMLAKHITESCDDRAVVSHHVAGGTTQRASSEAILNCHISSITDSICFIVVQEVGQAKRNRVSNDDILLFMRTMAPKLRPENLLSIDIVTRIKPDLPDGGKELPKNVSIAPASNQDTPTSSLWSESGWSDAQRKKILHSLGLRRKNSPVMAPLKSPYVHRQISRKFGRHRRKKSKNNVMNHGHLDLFLGPELSHLFQ